MNRKTAMLTSVTIAIVAVFSIVSFASAAGNQCQVGQRTPSKTSFDLSWMCLQRVVHATATSTPSPTPPDRPTNTVRQDTPTPTLAPAKSSPTPMVNLYP